jgi:hypothetical protein
MANTIQRSEIGGESIHVRDCYVWSEIHYLDSPSAYREFLPQDRPCDPRDDGLVMLDSPRRSSRSARDPSREAAVWLMIGGLLLLCLALRWL